MVDDFNPEYDQSQGFVIQDPDGNELGRIIYADHQGKPTMTFRSNYDIGFQVYSPNENRLVNVMRVRNESLSGVPSVNMLYELLVEGITANAVTSNLLRIEGGTIQTYRSPSGIPRGIEISSDRELRFGSYGSFSDMQLGSGIINIRKPINMNGNVITNDSDRRLKKNIKPNEPTVLDDYESLEFVNFEYKDQENYADGVQWGLIAQDAPLFNGYNKEEDLWYVNSSQQIMTNSLAIKQFVKELKSTKDTIHTLQQELSQANRKIQELERKIG